MKFLDGLFLYEIIMLGMGVLLFLLLSIAFIVLLVRSKPYGRLLPAFGLPIVMVGFPGIQSFEMSSDTLKIKTNSETVLQDPTNQPARAALAANVDSLAGRPIKDAATNLTIARAQIALGQIAQAEQKVAAVLKDAPQEAEAQPLKERIELDRKLASLSTTLQQDAGNATAKAELARIVEQASTVTIANPTTFTNLARAQAALGQADAAGQSVSKALAIQPEFKDAVTLKEQLNLSPAAAGMRSQ